MINIHARARNLVRKYGTNNPEKIVEDLKITMIKRPMSLKTKGFFRKALGKKFIVINSLLDEYSQRIVIAHELGHAILHSTANIYFIREQTLFPIGKYEVQANKFAAELLINDDDIIEEYTIPQMACYFGVPEQLVKYKLLRKKEVECL